MSREPLADRDGSAGQPFGRYRILQRLAAGPGRDTSIARLLGAGGFEPVVILRRFPICQDPQSIERQRDLEAMDTLRLCARVLNHQAIVTFFEVGERDGTGYAVSELVVGESAAAVATRARQHGLPLRPEHVGCLVRDALTGLAYAHNKQVEGRPLPLPHGRLRTTQLLVRIQEARALIDGFGLGGLGDAAAQAPSRPPSAARPVQPPDVRADLVAMGRILRELLTETPALPLSDELRAVSSERCEDAAAFLAALERCFDPRAACDSLRELLRALYPSLIPPAWTWAD